MRVTAASISSRVAVSGRSSASSWRRSSVSTASIRASRSGFSVIGISSGGHGRAQRSPPQDSPPWRQSHRGYSPKQLPISAIPPLMAEDEAPSSENEQLTRRSLDAETGDSAD